MTNPNPAIIKPLPPLLIILVIFSIFLFFINSIPAKAQKKEHFKVAVLVSMHIKPYMEALKGLRESLAFHKSVDTSVFILDQEILNRPTTYINELVSQSFDLFVSIGPEALNLLDQMASEHEISNVYTMVLDPEKISSSPNLLKCGISLSIPISHQIRDIRNSLPTVKRIGLLFNPEENSVYFRQTSLESFLSGFTIVPLEVSSSKQIHKVLRNNWDRFDGLWLIPDQTVISQTLVEFIIKEAFVNKKPVVGYNRFFYDAGSAMAFVLNFEQIGHKTGDLVITKLNGLPCGQSIPAYEMLFNKKVMESLGMAIPEGLP